MSKFFELMRDIVLVLNTFVRVDEEQALTEEQQTYARANINAASHSDLEEVQAEVSNLKADIEYVAIDITSFTIDYVKAEIGMTVLTVTVTWGLNKAPTTQTINGEAVDLSVGTWSDTNVSEDKTYTLHVTDEKGSEDTATVSIRFLNSAFYGAAEAPETVDSAFILSLSKQTLTDTRARTITVAAEKGQHIWYAIPARLGACSFAVGGFSGGFDLVDTIDFTNEAGYTESYYVYASTKTGLGETKVVVS